MDQELLFEFLQESKDLLETTDQHLLALEKHPLDKTLLNAVFRGFHTIKGSASFLDLDGLVKLCHQLETLFDLLRNGSLAFNETFMNLSLQASNEIREYFSALAMNPNINYEPPQKLLDQLETLQHQTNAPSVEVATVSNIQNNPSLTSHKHDLEEYYALLNQKNTMTNPAETTSLYSTEPPESDKDKNDKVETQAPVSEKETHIKVDTQRLDAVLTLASEVGLAKNRISALRTRICAKDFSDQSLSDLDRASNELERLVSSLQNAIMLTRMQPIGRLFSKYPRIIRDLARTLNKKIELEIAGHETEIDKGMIEDLQDPLVHLLRNSADHGIESPDTRAFLGKPETGIITLKAYQEGDRIILQIQDDGKGIDPHFIRKKAKEKNILDHATIDALTDQGALELIFHPGFSTAEKLSSVSGRGVGMDVVKTNINKMGGDITIESQSGVGTSMTIRIPLTLAVLPALLLQASDQPFAIPLNVVQEIITLSEHDVQLVSDQPMVNLRGDILPLVDLSYLLGFGKDTKAQVAAIVQINDRTIALCAQDFLGREEVMVKALEGIKPVGVSGIMVDARGDIVLILDLKELFNQKFIKSSDNRKEI